MPTFLDDLEIVDQTAIDQTGPQYIKGQWWNGEPKMKAGGGIAYSGGLLIDRDKYLPDFVKPAPGWADASHTFESGKTIKAVTTSRPVLAVIRTRFRWFVVKGGETSYYPRQAYDRSLNMRGQMQALCAVKGFDFPVVFSFKGMASKHFDQAVRDFTAKINEAVSRNARESKGATVAKYPRFAFWMELIPGPHEKVGEKGAESNITPPTLKLPELVDGAHLEANYVGRANLQAFQTHYHDAAAWAVQWDKGQAAEAEAPTDEAEAARAAEEYDDDPAMIDVSTGPVQTTAQELGLDATFGAGNPKKRPANQYQVGR